MTRPAVALPGRFVIGANYWSRAGGPRMWERFDPALVRAELAQLRAIGLDSLRMFAFAPTMMPRPPALDATMMARLQEFARLSEAAGMRLWPTPLVGHMSGENFDFPGQREKSPTPTLYRDPELLAWQEALVRGVVEALRPSPAVAGWVLTNEFPLWGTMAPADDAVAWATRMLAAARAVDPARPVGTGDGCMGGWPTRALAPQLDWIGPHIYYGDVDPLRHAWNSDFVLRSHQRLGRPVVLEEFGGSSTQAGAAEHAAYVREVYLACLGVGAAGAFVWCANDFDRHTLGLEIPYEHHAFELGFGIVQADGREKPAAAQLRALRALVDGLGDVTPRPAPARAALVRSDWLDRSFPFSWEDKHGLRRSLLQAYVLAAQAGIEVDVVHEDEPLDGYALILVPSTQKLRVPTWHKLEAAARAGATVYWSYFSGENEFHQGAWCPNFGALTGLDHHLRYGCFDLPGERCVLKGQIALSLPTGELHSPAPQSLARLPVTPRPGAQVESLAVDGAGRLAVAEHRLGAGKVIFCAYPIERYLMARSDGSARDAHRMYRLLADEAGLEPAYETHHPDVQARVLVDGRDDVVIVQHRGWTPSVDDASELPREAELLYDQGNPAPDAFGPKGARVYRVRGVRP